MLWNAATLQTVLNTLMVCTGAAGLAASCGLVLAISIVCLRVPLRKTFAVSLVSLVLVPVYVQAAAWSAGFGSQGWLRLSQVQASISPWKGIASVIWIHGTAAIPICFLLNLIGLSRGMNSRTRQSLLDFGPTKTITNFVIPSLWPWVVAGVLWTVAVTSNDMVVTNLFQVPTVTESVYQQVQFDQVRSISILLSGGFAVILGISIAIGFTRLNSRIGGEESGYSSPASYVAFESQGGTRIVAFAIVAVLVSVATLLPLSNLVIKAGWVATSSEEHLERYWSAAAAVQSTIFSPFAFSDELMWSLELSASSTALAMIVAIAAIYLCRWRWVLVGIVAVMGFLVASPGPLVNLAVIAMFDWEEPVWVGFLSDRTLVAPIIALQSRCLPIAFAVLGIAMLRFQHRHHTSLQLDRGLPLFARIWILAKGLKGPILMAAVVVFFVAFAELPCYLLVQPAGVTTVAMRMFELLHYGVKNQEAGLGLFLAIASMIPSFWLCRAFDLYRD